MVRCAGSAGGLGVDSSLKILPGTEIQAFKIVKECWSVGVLEYWIVGIIQKRKINRESILMEPIDAGLG